MTRTTTLWSLLLLSAALALGSCTKDATEQATGPEPEAKAASKLVFSSENAVRGELLVCFGEEAVAGIESSVMQVTRSGGVAYQSYLENIKTGASEVLSTVNGGKYGYMQGTSMACPHVSGVAALGLSYALQLGKTFTQNEFTTLLLTSVNDINQYCTGTKQYFTDKGSLATLDLSQYKKGMGTGYIDAYQVLMNVRGITCIPIPVGSQYTLNLQPYLGGGNLDLKITEISISAEDMNRLGISANPTIFANQIILKCTKPGSAVVRIKLLAGNGNNSGMNGMPITKEFAFIAREVHSQNGGWL